uniref:Putative secreted protein n=1 Tax=Rhipicephalus microplus TaxID=6941 RepID=A0A6G5A0H9_RHIMP
MRWTLLCSWTKLDAAFFSSVFATFESLPLLKGPQYYTYWSASGSYNAVVVTASILLPVSAMEINSQIFLYELYILLVHVYNCIRSHNFCPAQLHCCLRNFIL